MVQEDPSAPAVFHIDVGDGDDVRVSVFYIMAYLAVAFSLDRVSFNINWRWWCNFFYFAVCCVAQGAVRSSVWHRLPLSQFLTARVRVTSLD